MTRYLLSIDSGGIRGIIWDAILAGAETQFRIGKHNTLWEQYKVRVI